MTFKNYKRNISDLLYSKAPKVYCKSCRGHSDFPFRNVLMNNKINGVPHKILIGGKEFYFFCVELIIVTKEHRVPVTYYVETERETTRITNIAKKTLKDAYPDKEIYILKKYDYRTGSPDMMR